LKLTQKQKAQAFDVILKLLDHNSIEILFKEDHTGDWDFDSITDVDTFFEMFPIFLSKLEKFG